MTIKFDYVSVTSHTDSLLEHFYFNNIFEVKIDKSLLPAESLLSEFQSWRNNLQNTTLAHPSERSDYTEGNNLEFNRYIQYINSLKSVVLKNFFSPENPKANAFKSRWWKSQDDIEKHLFSGTTILRDGPGYKMSPHLDNDIIFAVLIINLKDNETSTRFHAFNDPNKIIYEAPMKRGEGVLFLNTPGSLHSITHEGTRDRFTSYTVYALHI